MVKYHFMPTLLSRPPVFSICYIHLIRTFFLMSLVSHGLLAQTSIYSSWLKKPGVQFLGNGFHMVQSKNIAITTSPITNNLSLFNEFRRIQIAMNEWLESCCRNKGNSVLLQILFAEGTNFSLGHMHTYHQSTLN